MLFSTAKSLIIKFKVSLQSTDRSHEGRELKPMLTMKNTLKKFLSDESGQSSTEYILILFLAFMVFSKLKEKIKPIIENLLGKTEEKGADALKEW